MISSSARRRQGTDSPVVVWVVVCLAILVLLVVVTRSEEEEPPPVIPTPTAGPVERPSPLFPTPTPSPTPTPTLIPEPDPTPTPTPTLIPLPTRRPRTTRAGPPQCIEFSSFITANVPGLGHNVVEVQVTNLCDRDLEPDELWFEACGYRDGGLVQSARARPFESAKRRGTVKITFDLPGSVDWYDDIRVGLGVCSP